MNTQDNIKLKKFIHFNNGFMLTCNLKQNHLELTLLDTNIQVDQYFFYQKIFTDESCPKGELLLFDTCQKVYKTLEILKQQNNLILQNGVVIINLKILFQTIKKQFKLQKCYFTQMQLNIMKTRQSFYLQKIRAQAQNDLLNSKINQHQNIRLKEKKQNELIIQKKDQQISQLKLQIEKLQKQINSFVFQLIKLKFEFNKKNTQFETLISSLIEKKSKKQKKIDKINQKQHVFKKQLQQGSSKYNAIHRQMTAYLNTQLKQINQQIKRKKLTLMKLELGEVFHGYARQFCQNFELNIKCIQILKTFDLKHLKILNLQSNNLGDKGWQILNSFYLPYLQSLYVGNNNLKNIQFNLHFQNLKLLNLMNSLESILMYPNILSEQSVDSLLNLEWENLQILGIDFKQFQNQEQSKLICNQYQWNKFIIKNFANFKKLKYLHILWKNITNLIYQQLQQACKLKNIKLQHCEMHEI